MKNARLLKKLLIFPVQVAHTGRCLLGGKLKVLLQTAQTHAFVGHPS